MLIAVSILNFCKILFQNALVKGEFRLTVGSSASLYRKHHYADTSQLPYKAIKQTNQMPLNSKA